MEGAKLRILVAEDDKSIASVLKRRLEAAHYSVDVCHDGGAAYDYLRLTDYDVAIMEMCIRDSPCGLFLHFLYDVRLLPRRPAPAEH